MNSPLTPNSRSYLNQFTQPDIIVPNRNDPADFNRFSYAKYNPIRYKDPSGHLSCDADYVAEGDCSELTTIQILALYYGIFFLAGDAGFFTAAEISGIYLAAEAVGIQMNRMMGGGGTGAELFKAAFKTDSIPLYFLKGNKSDSLTYDGSGYYDDDNDPSTPDVPLPCEISAGACALGLTRLNSGTQVRVIKVVSSLSSVINIRNNMVHEMGHIYGNSVLGGVLFPGGFVINRNDYLRPDDSETGIMWQMNRDPTSSETFADFFVAWTFNAWHDDPLAVNASTWMSEFMANSTK